MFWFGWRGWFYVLESVLFVGCDVEGCEIIKVCVFFCLVVKDVYDIVDKSGSVVFVRSWDIVYIVELWLFVDGGIIVLNIIELLEIIGIFKVVFYVSMMVIIVDVLSNL